MPSAGAEGVEFVLSPDVLADAAAAFFRRELFLLVGAVAALSAPRLAIWSAEMRKKGSEPGGERPVS